MPPHLVGYPIVTRNILLLLAFGLTLSGTSPALAQTPVSTAPEALAAAQTDAAALAPRREGDDMVMGAPNAPVTIIEYASLTCPHCAAFNANTFPQLKSDYVDRGLVKYVYRDFPLDRMALEAAKIARCAGPDKYFGFVDVLFRQQQSWTRGNDAEQIMGNLRRLAKVGGMSDATFDSCSKDKAIENAVLEQSLKGERELKVGSTPTLIINGQKYTGALSFEELDKVLKPLVGKS
jgi:protein-disulfide isomerase